MNADANDLIVDLAEMCGDDCRWFLVGLTEGNVTASDGCWSSFDDIRRALYLRQRIGDSSADWVAVHILPVTPLEYAVNREAVEALKALEANA